MSKAGAPRTVPAGREDAGAGPLGEGAGLAVKLKNDDERGALGEQQRKLAGARKHHVPRGGTCVKGDAGGTRHTAHGTQHTVHGTHTVKSAHGFNTSTRGGAGERERVRLT